MLWAEVHAGELGSAPVGGHSVLPGRAARASRLRVWLDDGGGCHFAYERSAGGARVSAWRLSEGSYVVRVPNDALNGTTGRRWFAIANERGIGHFRNRRNAKAAVKKAVRR